ncbi:MAG: hypothetical protein KME64_13990 [Scytonematopsis contorta HA4267-MV1]|jgi:hypothetical protein|nr:hypothetical protein [Scytonematopsis contorta HA4267-MV1]
MSNKSTPNSRRGRGVVLTNKGWQKLQQAMLIAESEHNLGLRFTREQLKELTRLSLQTMSRILKRQDAVDKLSIEYFLPVVFPQWWNILQYCSVKDFVVPHPS